MKHRKYFILIPILAALISCTPSQDIQRASEARAQSDLAERLEGYVAAAPQRCVMTSQLGSPVPYGDNIVVFSGNPGTIYVNQLRAPCPGAGDETDVFVVEVNGSQLCANEPLKRVDRYSGIPGPHCSLGQFTPYSKAR